MDSKAAENLVGVLKSIVREEIRNQHKVAEEMPQDRAGAPWSKHEDAKLVTEYTAAAAILAILHQRSTGAIESRLAQLAKRHELFRPVSR